MERPLPTIDDISRAYWAGARDGQLVLMCCADCTRWIHPPRATCPHCRSEHVAPAPASGKGSVYSWSVMHQPGNPGFDDKRPFVVLTVELAEQKGLLTIGNTDVPAERLEIGMPLEVVFEKVTDEITLPQWRARKETGE